jgi:hypothetical protein
VVGVIARTADLNFTLTLQGPQSVTVPASLNRTDLTSNFEQTFTVPTNNSRNSSTT